MHGLLKCRLINPFILQDSHFIHCIKPNNEKLPNKFDNHFVSTQLNTIGAVPIVNLIRHGYAAKISYSELLAKIKPHNGECDKNI